MAIADFSELTAQVERIKQVRPSIVAIIEGIADRVQAAVDADNAGDNTKLAALATDLRGEADAFAEAAVKGTPASGGEEPLPPLPEPGGETGSTEGGGR
jgi:hypothetical protein